MEVKAKVLMSGEVWDKINWFTRNWDKEIGAVGTVEKRKDEHGNGFFYIDKLLFPKQEVGGAHVHIDNSMWEDLIKEHFEDLSKVAFYWHKHPGGCPQHSNVDEEDTFETFMSNEGEREFFVFLQTALKEDKIVTESRIDLRDPRVTILKENIELKYEVSKERKKINDMLNALDEKMETECNKIVEKCVVSPPSKQSNNTLYNQKYYRNCHASLPKEEIDEDTIMALKELFGYEKDYVDNNIVAGVQTGEKDAMSIKVGNGHIKVCCAENMKQKLIDSLSKGPLKEFTGSWKPTPRYSETLGQTTEFYIQPKKCCFDRLTKVMFEEFMVFNEKVIGDVAEVIGISPEELRASAVQNCDESEDEEDWVKQFNKENGYNYGDSPYSKPQEVIGYEDKSMVVEQKGLIAINSEPELVSEILAEIVSDFSINYKDPSGQSLIDEGIVYNLNKKPVGMVYIKNDYSCARIIGEGLVPYVSAILKEYLKSGLVDKDFHWISKISSEVSKNSKEASADDSATRRGTD